MFESCDGSETTLREYDDASTTELSLLCRAGGTERRIVLQVTARSAELITAELRTGGDLLTIRKAFTLSFEKDAVPMFTYVYRLDLDLDREDMSFILMENLRERLGCEELEPTQPGDLSAILLEGRTHYADEDSGSGPESENPEPDPVQR